MKVTVLSNEQMTLFESSLMQLFGILLFVYFHPVISTQ
jgi:hypothetical protein